jgi:hypothetical protein
MKSTYLIGSKNSLIDNNFTASRLVIIARGLLCYNNVTTSWFQVVDVSFSLIILSPLRGFPQENNTS